MDSQEKPSKEAALAVINLPISVIRVTGDDRDRFLHSFCTADVKKLSEGQRCEAFFLNPKGKTISHGWMVKRHVDLLIVSTSESPVALIEHLDRYLISDDVQIEDTSEQWRCGFVFGTEVSSTLQSAGVPVPAGDAVVLDGFRTLFNAELGGDGVCVLEPVAGDVNTLEVLCAAGAVDLSLQEFHSRRVACGTPWVGFDITEANLPQEFLRDATAISFTKGCYLGQETVARLDAMGHVNQRFVKLRFGAAVPDVQAVLHKDGRKVAVVTSVGADGRALGFVRKAAGADASGVVQFDDGEFEYVAG